jgi:hypothetical protein
LSSACHQYPASVALPCVPGRLDQPCDRSNRQSDSFFSLGLAVCDASTWRLSVTSIARKSLFPRESGPPRVPADSSSSSAYLSTLIKSGLASGLVTMTCAFYGREIHSQFLKLGGVRISPLIWIEIHMWLSPGCVWVARTIPKWASGAGTVVCYLRKRRRRC